MNIRSLLVVCILVFFGVMATNVVTTVGDELMYRVDSVKCGCCGILEKGDTVLKVQQCFGKPDYIDYEEIPADPFHGDEMIAGPEIWYYKKDDMTYRFKIVNGLVSEIQEIPSN